MHADSDASETVPASEHSEQHPVTQEQGRKRIDRACDHCRKARVKCVRTADLGSCEYCMQNGAACTFDESHFKRGPPKGYIRAMEQRLQLVETILGSVIASEDPASRSLVNDLRRDPIAHSILDRVSHDIYRANVGAAADEYQSSMLTNRATSQHARGLGSRPTRETRVERELQVMSHSFDDLQPPPDWQSSLLAVLNDASKPGTSSQPFTSGQFTWPGTSIPYTMDELEDGVYSQSSTSGRTHSSSGLDQMFHQSDSSEITFLNSIVGNIAPGANWPSNVRPLEIDVSVATTTPELTWPHQSTQERLFDTYFTHIHTLFPMVKSVTFVCGIDTGVRKEQDEFLTLSIFATASLYHDDQRHDLSSGAGNSYFSAAQQCTASVVQTPSLAVCQGLTLLSYYRIATGTAERAWADLGKAIRMARVLGIHKASNKAIESINKAEEDERCCTWWSLSILDKFLAWSLGRRPSILEPQSKYALPTLSQDLKIQIGDHEIEHDPQSVKCFRKLASLSSIIGDILGSLYAVVTSSVDDHESCRIAFMTRLNKWLGKLNDDLCCDLSQYKPAPKPYVSILHLWYWSAVVLVNRDFALRQEVRSDPKTFDNGNKQLLFATHQIYRIATVFRNAHGFQASCPVMVSFLFNVGIVHLGNDAFMVDQILLYLTDLKVIWPSSAEKLQLLADAKVIINQNTSQPSREGRSSNASRSLLTNEKPDTQISTPKKPAMVGTGNTLMNSPTDGLDNGSAMIAQMLGLQLPGVPVPADNDVGMLVNQDDGLSTTIVPRFAQDTVHPDDLVTSSRPYGINLFDPVPRGPQHLGSTTLPIVPGQGIAEMELYGMQESLAEQQQVSLIPDSSRASTTIVKQEEY